MRLKGGVLPARRELPVGAMLSLAASFSQLHPSGPREPSAGATLPRLLTCYPWAQQWPLRGGCEALLVPALPFLSGGHWPSARTLPSCTLEETCAAPPLPQPLVPLAGVLPKPSPRRPRLGQRSGFFPSGFVFQLSPGPFWARRGALSNLAASWDDLSICL